MAPGPPRPLGAGRIDALGRGGAGGRCEGYGGDADVGECGGGGDLHVGLLAAATLARRPRLRQMSCASVFAKMHLG